MSSGSGNIALIAPDSIEGEDLIIYTRYLGSETERILKKTLRTNVTLWFDHQTFASVLFSDMLQQGRPTEFGISTSIVINDQPILVADFQNQCVYTADYKDLRAFITIPQSFAKFSGLTDSEGDSVELSRLMIDNYENVKKLEKGLKKMEEEIEYNDSVDEVAYPSVPTEKFSLLNMLAKSEMESAGEQIIEKVVKANRWAVKFTLEDFKGASRIGFLYLLYYRYLEPDEPTGYFIPTVGFAEKVCDLKDIPPSVRHLHKGKK
jgi:hypothetical protein